MDLNKSIERLRKYYNGEAIVITKRNEFSVKVCMTRIMKQIKRGNITAEEVNKRIKDGK